MTPTANLASSEADADHPAGPAAEAGPFVLNLCSSTTPMALAQTELPELKRFTFFVSRRFEEGRERFRLHMGFFASQAEAEEWLGVVRDIYPGAWAGEAPGKKLRARATEAAAAQARHAVGPQPKAAAPTVPPKAPAAAVTKPQSARPAAAPKIPTLVPTLHPPASPSVTAAAPARAAAPHAAKVTPQPGQKRPQGAIAAPVKAGPAAPAASGRTMPAARATTAPAPPPQARPTNVAAGGQRPAARPESSARVPPAAVAPGARPKPMARPIATKPVVPRPAAPPTPRPGTQPPPGRPVFANSNVKEVLAALDTHDSAGETRLMQAPALARGEPAEDATLTDTQVLKFLETRRDEESVPAQPVLQADAAAESGISLLKPDDTGTRRALKDAVSHNDPVSFAVQLQWSVQPVELNNVPPLAIFSAYTLYSVEGSREGRKWYGLRLGFFNDAISAKQVAYYVRSEFNSVAVVPVSPQERGRATEDNQRFAGVGGARKRPRSEDNEFKLIEDETPRAAPAPAAAQTPATQPAAEVAKPAAATPPRAPTTRSARKGGSKVEARERRTPQTLEETLEILGANELAIDSGTGESLNDTGVRHLRVELQKNTPFSRLLERLSERVKKS
jgi:hypothetical protein